MVSRHADSLIRSGCSATVVRLRIVSSFGEKKERAGEIQPSEFRTMRVHFSYALPTTRSPSCGIVFLKSNQSVFFNAGFFDITGVPGKKHYYLNVDRCAYGGTIKLSGGVKDIANSKQVCGPMIFAVNHNCTRVYYYQDAPHEGWVKYKSVNYYPDLFKQLKCKPKEDFQ